MDYTTSALVKEALRITTAGDDALIARAITAASRATDRLVCRSQDLDNYFYSETVTAERLIGVTNEWGQLSVWPHKSKITALTSVDYKLALADDWESVDAADYEISGLHAVVADLGWGKESTRKAFVKITYTGGHATTAANLPADVVEAVTILACRIYREYEAQLNDSIGLAEIATTDYTSAWPARALGLLQPFIRKVAW